MARPLDWQLVKDSAPLLGVQINTVEQWKSRNWVPPFWWPKLVRATGGKVSIKVLEDLVPRREAAE